MNIDTLKKALENEKTTILNLQVLRKISSNTFLVGDSSAIAILTDPRKTKVTLVEGAFVKIIKPLIKEGKLICNEKFSLVRGSKFEFKFDETDIENCISTATGGEQISQLSDFDHISASQNIPNITLKVCSVSRPYVGKYSEYRNIIAKDISGNKVTVTLYKKMKESCQQGDVYTFQKLKKTDYKAADEVYFRLSSTSVTTIEKLGAYQAKNFEKILIGDGACEGQFVGKKQRLKVFKEPV